MPKQRIHGKMSSVSPLFIPPLDDDPAPLLAPCRLAMKVVVVVVVVKTKGVAETGSWVEEVEEEDEFPIDRSPAGAASAETVPGEAASEDGGSNVSEASTAATNSAAV